MTTVPPPRRDHAAADPLAAGGFEIVAIHGDERQHFAFPRGEVTIGAGAGNDWVLPFRGVSRRHAVAVPGDGGIELRDAGSKNGLWSQGVRVETATLAIDGEVRLGPATLRLVPLRRSDPILPLPGERASRARGARDGATSTPSLDALADARGPHGALALARRVAAAGAPGPAERDAWLAEARRTIGASALLVVAAARRDLAVHAVVGEAPGERALAALEAALAAREARKVAGVGCWLVAAAPAAREPLAVAALLQPEAVAADWQELLLLVLAERLFTDAAPLGVAGARAALRDDDPLRYPEAMVRGDSAAFQRLLADVRNTLRASTFLLVGETGTGKELFARLLHDSGPRAGGPFVPCNVAEIPPDQIEAELFGIARGAATGVDGRPGLFRDADGGTLFLDEIGELPRHLQPKLLRALQERTVRTIGTSTAHRVDVRIVAATNRDLSALVREGHFRDDLFHRLHEIVLRLPPLRERPEDIPALATALVARLAARHGKRIRGVRWQALALLSRQPWPGNVRQLQNELAWAVLACPNGEAVGREHLRPELVGGESAWMLPAAVTAIPPNPPHDTQVGAVASEASDPLDLAARTADAERHAIRTALARTGGRLAAAAKLLGITREGLRKKRKRLGLG